MTVRLLEHPLTHSLIGAFFEVYNQLGYGLVERPYVRAMDEELRERGACRQARGAGGAALQGSAVRLSAARMIVDGRLVVEAKAMLDRHEAHVRQLFSSVRATPYDAGLLLNVGLRPRFTRLVWENGARCTQRLAPVLRVHP